MHNQVAALHWRGDVKIQLRPVDVKGSGLENRILAISFLNQAFDLFFACRLGIAQCSDAKMRERMTDELEAAASSGPQLGQCDDLRAAIEHAVALKSTDGFSAPYQWRDQKLKLYQSIGFHQKTAFDAAEGRRPTIWQQGDVRSAKAGVDFLEQMDRRVGILQAKFARIEQKWGYVHRIGMRVYRDGSKPAAADWKVLAGSLKTICREVSESQQYLWLSGSGLEARFNQLTACLGSSTSVLSVAKRIETVADRMQKGSASLTSVKESLELLCVLGTFYARALDLIPGARTWISHVQSRRWNQVRLLSTETKSARLAELEAASGLLSNGRGLRAYPLLGSYKDARSLGLG